MVTSDPPTVASSWRCTTSWRLHNQEDTILDVPFSLEKVESSVRGLKLGNAGGWDQLQPEHLYYGGSALITWIQQILELETVPEPFKLWYCMSSV